MIALLDRGFASNAFREAVADTDATFVARLSTAARTAANPQESLRVDPDPRRWPRPQSVAAASLPAIPVLSAAEATSVGLSNAAAVFGLRSCAQGDEHVLRPGHRRPPSPSPSSERTTSGTAIGPSARSSTPNAVTSAPVSRPLTESASSS